MARYRFIKDWTYPVTKVQSRTYKSGSVRDDLDGKIVDLAKKAGAIVEITATGAVVAAPAASVADKKPAGTEPPKAA